MAFSNGEKSLANQSSLLFSLDANNSINYSGTTSLGATFNTTNTGSLNNATVTDAIGGRGKSFYFDGANDNISINTAENSITQAVMTLECWFWCDDLSHDVVFSNSAANGGGMNFKIQTTRMYLYGLTTNGSVHGVYQWINGYPSADTWHHLALCISGDGNTGGSGVSANTDLRLYLDGIKRDWYGPTTYYCDDGYAAASNNPWHLGEDPSGGGDYKGYINEFKTYNRALTEEEVLQNFNATKHKYGL